ncbi:MAG: hypothetical protein ACOWWH_10020 [Eubacteriaceae bacterium]
MVEKNAIKAIDQNVYLQQYNEMIERQQQTQSSLTKVEEKKTDKIRKKKRIQSFIDTLKSETNIIQEFDESLWKATIDKIVV